MPKPWERQWGTPQPAGPSVVFQAPPDPMKAAAERRAEEDQAMQRANMERAQANDARQAIKDQRDEIEWNATHNPDGSKKPVPGAATEGERKAASFLTRALGAEKSYGATGVGPRSLIGQGMKDAAPDLLNALPSFIGNSPERQVADTNQDEFIAATLRQDSGAAIPPHEIERQRRIYFPMPNEGPEAIEAKRQARIRALQGLAASSGAMLTEDQKKALAEIEKAAGGGAGSGEDRKKQEMLGTLVPGDVANKINEGKLSPEQQAAYDAFNKANPNATADQLRTFSKAMGWDVVNADDIVKARDQGGGVAPASSGIVRPPNISDARGEGGAMEGADAFVRGAADTLSLGFSDELAAAGDTLFNGGTMDDNLRRQRAIARYDAEYSPWLRGGGQLAGGLAFPIGRGATTVGELAGVGGMTGAGYGFGSGETMKDRFTGAAMGGAAGAALGAGFGKLGEIWKNKRPPSGPGGGGAADAARDVGEAATDLGIDILPADAGGPFTRAMTTVARSTPGGVVPITKAAQRSQQQAGGALAGIAAREGSVAPDLESMGNAVREGALKFRSGSRASIGRIYDRAAQEAGDARIAPKAALEALDANIAELSQVPGGADGLAVLQGLRDDLAQRGTITVNGIRGMRTQLRQKFAKDNLRGSDLERRVMGVIDAASDDLASSLEAQGKAAAAKTYREADRQYAERIKTLDDVIMPIIGKKGEKSGEQIATAINAAAKGNNARLSKLFETLPEEEAGVARATMIDNMGKAGPGAQNAAGDEFSFNAFLTNWNKLGASAKNAIFRGENREAIDKLALIAERSKAAAKYQNYSNTGLAVLGAATGSTAIASMFTLGKVLAAQYAAGRLLASPKVAKALLGIAQAKNPEAVATRISNLSGLAAREPVLSAEITQLQQKLMQAMNDNGVSRAVASPEGQNEQNK